MQSLLQSVILLLAALGSSQIFANQVVHASAARTSSTCDVKLSGALTLSESMNKSRSSPKIHVPSSELSLVDRKDVESPCASEITNYVASQAFVGSGAVFVLRDNRKIDAYPWKSVDRPKIPARAITSLPGYVVSDAEVVGVRSSSEGKRTIYLGVLKGRVDNKIVRFDVIDGKAPKLAKLLVTTTRPVFALGFLPAPDTTDGAIGFAEQVGPNRASLYSYSWRHGDLDPIAK